MPRFLIGSSYFDNGKNGQKFRQEFAHVWSANTARANPERVVVVCEAGSVRPNTGHNEQIISLSGDLGHCHDLIAKKKPHEFSGWSSSMVSLAMLAYTNEADFIFKEEDCLAFGDWVSQMYQDLRSGDLVFGYKHRSPPWMPCSQSLFLVRHRFIPEFVSTYLSLGGDNRTDNLGEHKFCKLESQFGINRIRRLSFGVDRERPIPYDARVFYAQQITPDELAKIRELKLV